MIPEFKSHLVSIEGTDVSREDGRPVTIIRLKPISDKDNDEIYKVISGKPSRKLMDVLKRHNNTHLKGGKNNHERPGQMVTKNG